VGGLLIGLLVDGDLDLHPSGIIGSLAGAIIVTAVWRWMRNRSAPAKPASSRSGNPAKRNQGR
jgi:hypothetical protein